MSRPKEGREAFAALGRERVFQVLISQHRQYWTAVSERGIASRPSKSEERSEDDV